MSSILKNASEVDGETSGDRKEIVMAEKRTYPEGKSWTFTRSDGATKMYILTCKGDRGTVVQKNGKLLEVTYNGKLLSTGK